MTTLAPSAISGAFTRFRQVVPTARLGGIVGDADHGRSGYHISRQDCYANDYSVLMADDKLGDSRNASALDITLSADQMRKFSSRLMALCKANDPRIYALREWFGTIDGVRVTGWDRHVRTNYGDDTYTSSDDSHLWHIHLSGYRRYSDDAAAWLSLINALLGEDDAVTPAEISAIAKAVRADLLNTDDIAAPNSTTAKPNNWSWRSHIVTTSRLVGAIAKVVNSTLTRVVDLQSSVDALRAEVKASQSGSVAITPSSVPVTGTLTIGAAK